METKQINSQLNLLITLYDAHTTYYPNALDGITDKDTHNRLNTKANHIAWIAGSLVHARYDLAYAVGVDKNLVALDKSMYELFKDYKGIQDDATYPSLSVYRKAWTQITPVLKEALINLSDEQLRGPDPFDMPGEDIDLLTAITYCIDRESYCIGQLGLYRRLLGYDAMKWQ